ncbi:MAG: sialate O-acetylesterase, partial [Phycisphaerae bacterium]|nr:sialate O-acetylesterase [Phycisphaerae bacterium]
MAASAESRTLSVQGRNRITLADVLVGDVWLASGQSNMNRPVGAKAIEGAAHPNLRLFTTNGKIPRQERLNDTVGWVICTPQTIATCGDIVGKNGRRRPFSEVAYEFSRRVHRKTGTPVGIIHTSMGGSTAKDWTPNPDIAMQHPFDQDHGDVRHKWGIVYQSRLRGLVPYTLRGVVWYQGEDDGRNRRYGEELEAMILKWRRLWSDP